MRRHIRSSMIFVALVLCAGAAQAREGTATAELALRAAPSANTELLLTIPPGASVSVGTCARGWCKVTWNSYSGFAKQSGLAISAYRATRVVRADDYAIPVYPRYPYRAGHYPKADWYYDLPPYTAIVPSFYRKRFFMMAQERNRYRYMPHIFHGYSDGDSIDYAGDVDIDYKSLTTLNGD